MHSKSLFQLKLFDDNDYTEMANDVVKTIIIWCVAFAIYMSASYKVKFSSIDFMELLIYLIIGLVFYHLIVKKLILFI